jgi:hypothetical protein
MNCCILDVEAVDHDRESFEMRAKGRHLLIDLAITCLSHSSCFEPNFSRKLASRQLWCSPSRRLPSVTYNLSLRPGYWSVVGCAQADLDCRRAKDEVKQTSDKREIRAREPLRL